MQKKVLIERLIIFPNTTFPKIKADYIISARCVEATTSPRGTISSKWAYYTATTDTKSVYDQFWNDALSNEDKVPAITHMLYRLKEENGCDFSYIQVNKKPADERGNGKIAPGT